MILNDDNFDFEGKDPDQEIVNNKRYVSFRSVTTNDDTFEVKHLQ